MSDGENSLALGEHGQTSNCDTWILPSDNYFRAITIGYNEARVTHLKMITNRGTIFTRGTLGDSDSETTQWFTSETPLVGIQGYETEESLTAIGLIRFECPLDTNEHSN